VQIAAESFGNSDSTNAAAIVRRWLGDADRYGKV